MQQPSSLFSSLIKSAQHVYPAKLIGKSLENNASAVPDWTTFTFLRVFSSSPADSAQLAWFAVDFKGRTFVRVPRQPLFARSLSICSRSYSRLHCNHAYIHRRRCNVCLLCAKSELSPEYYLDFGERASAAATRSCRTHRLFGRARADLSPL